MAIVVFSPEQLRFLRSLHEHRVRFIVVGLSAAVLQGATVSTQDIDLWIENLGDSQFQAAVVAAGGFYIPPGVAGTNPPMLGPESLRLFDLVVHLHGLDPFNQEFGRCSEVVIDGVALRLLPVARIIASKRAANRPKDLAAMPSLEALLAATKVS